MVFPMICDIFFPAYLLNIHFLCSKFVYIKSLDFILQCISIHIFCPSHLLAHFTFLFPRIIFISNFVLSSYNLYPFNTLTISAQTRHTKSIFLSRVISHPFSLLLKYLCSLYTFKNLCQFVVDRIVVIALFFSILSIGLH